MQGFANEQAGIRIFENQICGSGEISGGGRDIKSRAKFVAKGFVVSPERKRVAVSGGGGLVYQIERTSLIVIEFF